MEIKWWQAALIVVLLLIVGLAAVWPVLDAQLNTAVPLVDLSDQ